ncbi:FAD/NAD(P)-binding protein [Streptosporangium sp. NBC_01495]|uniref:FAD/NAD(P)-binding protein n=1 Tax=Streptosporangium sp. NBC_01495 TaxID=2903899 RepID=UPI002E2F2649|nr:FAD/NAD(P)-binding protein [Streptosporangium sp. NBC_01495]
MSASIAVVGAGPTGTCLVERICANAADLLGWPSLDVHVIDPHPPGGGRVWRHDQPDLLWMNSTAADVTLFTDESVRCEGPIRPGPTLAEWLGGDPGRFASRPAQNGYLSHVFRHAVANAPRGVRVHVHAARAVDLADVPGGQTVTLEDGRTIEADAVILAQGHGDVTPTREENALAGLAARGGLRYLPTGYAADLDLDGIPAGEPVIMRGMGLAFVDLMVLLTSGRGGRFVREYDGELVYLPNGREPLLHVGSRRGVPYHSKTGYPFTGARPPVPRFLTREALGEGPWNFRRDVWPLVAKELAFAYYHELITAHPKRAKLGWEEFEEGFAAEEWRSLGMRRLVREAVPRHLDRLDFDRLDRPLDGIRFGDQAGLQKWMHGYLAVDLQRRSDPAHSADHAMILGLLSVYGVLAELGVSDPWFGGFFSYVASGPPGPRLEELRALARAGVVTFLGADLKVDHHDGRWRAQSPTAPGGVTATTLVEARLPAPSVSRAVDPLITALRDRGELDEESGLVNVRPADRRLLDRSGTPHPRRFAFGPWVVGGRATGGFARPRLNAPLFRHADALARIVLSEAAGTQIRRHVA